MRILVVNWSSRQVGGTETYLGRIMALLAADGCQLAFAWEVDGPADRAHLPLPGGTTTFQLSISEAHDDFQSIRGWRPDVIYAHGLLDPDIEERLLGIAPAVFFAHSYYGTCISGDKTHKFPVVRPCGRTFGPACLAIYFPRRCGGMSPLTMTRDYIRQRRRLSLLERYAAVVTSSDHMRRELVRHDAAAGRVFTVAFPSTLESTPADLAAGSAARSGLHRWHLTFAGRMERLKGGAHLLDALPEVRRALGSALHLTMAGDGPERRAWEQQARQIVARDPDVSVEFVGWLPPPRLSVLLGTTDLFVMPSLWPEPYGLAGAEANRHGVPVVAYRAGGIPEWLEEGVTGFLAPADPPTAGGLAAAIVRCLQEMPPGRRVSDRARARTGEDADRIHVALLLKILKEAAGLSNDLPIDRAGAEA
jgi:glycosyltransferase involved in cell wall biosynthesis